MTCPTCGSEEHAPCCRCGGVCSCYSNGDQWIWCEACETKELAREALDALSGGVNHGPGRLVYRTNEDDPTND